MSWFMVGCRGVVSHTGWVVRVNCVVHRGLYCVLDWGVDCTVNWPMHSFSFDSLCFIFRGAGGSKGKVSRGDRVVRRGVYCVVDWGMDCMVNWSLRSFSSVSLSFGFRGVVGSKGKFHLKLGRGFHDLVITEYLKICNYFPPRLPGPLYIALHYIKSACVFIYICA